MLNSTDKTHGCSDLSATERLGAVGYRCKAAIANWRSSIAAAGSLASRWAPYTSRKGRPVTGRFPGFALAGEDLPRTKWSSSRTNGTSLVRGCYPLCRKYDERRSRSQHRSNPMEPRRVGCRDALPAALSLIVIDIARRQIPELVARLRAPPQESPGHTAPLLNRRRREAALVAHPGDVPVELAPVQKRDGGFSPPTKKPQPRSPGIDDSPRWGCRPAKVLPLQRNRHQLRHADAAVDVWAETLARGMASLLHRSTARKGATNGADGPLVADFPSSPHRTSIARLRRCGLARLQGARPPPAANRRAPREPRQRPRERR
jgi:hypothetical protein